MELSTADSSEKLMISPNDRIAVPHEDPLLLIRRGLRKAYNLWIKTAYPFASRGQDVWIHYTCQLDRSKSNRIQLGNYVRLRQDVCMQVLDTPEKEAQIAIVLEDRVDIGFCSILSAKNNIHIGKEVSIAQSVVIADHLPAHEDTAMSIKLQGPAKGGRIRIGDGCFIGHGAAILCDKGELVLGDHCIVAAKSVVTRSFPPYSLVSGNPARIVSQFDAAEEAWITGEVRKSAASDLITRSSRVMA